MNKNERTETDYILEAIKDMDERDYAAFRKNQERLAQMNREPFCEPETWAGGLKISAITFLVLVVGAFSYMLAAENLDPHLPESWGVLLILLIIALAGSLLFGVLFLGGLLTAKVHGFESALFVSCAIGLSLCGLYLAVTGSLTAVYSLFSL